MEKLHRTAVKIVIKVFQRKSILFGKALHLCPCNVWVKDKKLHQEGKGKNEEKKEMENGKNEEMHGEVNGIGVDTGRSASVCWHGGESSNSNIWGL